MGNKLCKKKTDPVDNPKSPTPFDRIINRLHLRPNAWKSDSHLNQKQVSKTNASNGTRNEKDNVSKAKLLSKSSDWTDATMEVSEKDEAIHLRNPKLSLIFDNESSTPVPPPRKHKKGIREKLEAVAKSGLQAFQSKKPVEEPLCVKKIVNHTCPVDDHDCAIHNRNHKREKNEINEAKKQATPKNKEAKRRKNLSVVSLPNYNELKLTVANFEDIDKKSEQNFHNSMQSLPTEQKKLSITASTGKLETCMTRCRSFGSLFPQQLRHKLKVRKIPTDVESDDSFGGLEDWDLRIIEHYNPKDASLPRVRKAPTQDKNTLSDIESLIVKDEDIPKPVAPNRRSESLLKKINKEAKEEAVIKRKSQEKLVRSTSESDNPTPPPTPQRKRTEPELPHLTASQLPTEENGVVEHSTLMKILEAYSMKDKQDSALLDEETMPEETKEVLSDESFLPTVKPLEVNKDIASIQDFLTKEKMNANWHSPEVYNKKTNLSSIIL